MGSNRSAREPCRFEKWIGVAADILPDGERPEPDAPARMRLDEVPAIVPANIPAGAFVPIIVDMRRIVTVRSERGVAAEFKRV